MHARSSGILLPIPCLPSRFGIGDLGPIAYRFADSLHSAGQRVWQILPVNPTTSTYQHSPYHGTSTFAFNPLLISPELLAADGLLGTDDLQPPAWQDRIDYGTVAEFKQHVLNEACRRFKQRLPDEGYTRFCAQNAAWLDDYALFTALCARYPLMGKGAALLGLGRYEESLPLFDDILKVQPQNKEAQVSKGMALYLAGRPEEALDIEAFRTEFTRRRKDEMERLAQQKT